MNTPTLRAAIEQQNWVIAAHMLVYGLVKAQTDRAGDGKNREESHCGKERRTARQSKRS